MLVLAVAAAALQVGSAAAQDEPKKKTFDVFSDEDEEEAPPEPKKETKPVERPAPEPAKVEAPAKPEAPPADRDTTLVLVIADSAQAASLAFRIGAEATRSLAAAKSYAAVDMERVLLPGAEKQRADDLRAGFASLDRGMKAFEDLDLENAGTELENATNTLLAYSDDLDAAARRALENAIFGYGATTLFEGQTDLAESIFVALLLLSPRYAPDAERYPSNVVARFEDLRGRVEQRPTGGITVNTMPKGADVYVDGSFRGASPLEIGGLADGQHVVVLKRLGFKPYGTLAPVTADRSASIDVDLEDMPGAELVAELRTELSDDVQAGLQFGHKLSVAHLAILRLDTGLSGATVAGSWLDIRHDKLVAKIPETRVLPDPPAAAKAINDAIARAEAGPLIADSEKAASSGSILETWWFWTIVGAVAVAGGAVATAAALHHEDRGPPPNGVVLGF